MTRQAIQQIWHRATETTPTPFIGLLGSSHQQEITHAVEVRLTDHNTLQQLTKAWQREGIALCGIIHALPPNREQIQSDITQLSPYFQSVTDSPFICLQLNVDTKGCLKSLAYLYQNQQLTAIPILLIEDRQSPLKT